MKPTVLSKSHGYMHQPKSAKTKKTVAKPLQKIPAKASGNRLHRLWIDAEQAPTYPLRAIKAGAIGSVLKTGSVKQPQITKDHINIMWQNASLTPSNAPTRIAALHRWLKTNVASAPKNDAGMVDCLLDVSHNKMGDKGVGELITTLLKFSVAVRVLKLYHMDLGDGVTPHIVRMIKANAASPLRELHLSHNKLSRLGAQHILVAAGNSGAYPCQRANGSSKTTPLWLRLEHNPITRIDNLFESIVQRGWSICTDPPCKHQPTCMIAVPAFSSQAQSLPEANTARASLGSLKPIPQHGKKGNGRVCASPAPTAKSKARGTLALTPLPTMSPSTPSGSSKSKGRKGSTKGRRVSGREGAPEDGETKRRGKEVYKLLWDMAQTETLVQSWRPDWERASAYQRMEWFGDKILGHLLTERVWSILDDTSEGFLTKFHQQATCNKTLAYIFDMCNIMAIMDAMNTIPHSRQPLSHFRTGKDVVKRRGDAIEVIFGDLTTQSTKFADSPEALKISTCMQLLADLCVRCAEYYFEMPFSSNRKTSAAVPKSVTAGARYKAVAKSNLSALNSAVPKAVSKPGPAVSKASGRCRPRGMTIVIAASPERYQQGDTIRPVVGERFAIGTLTYTECILLRLHGWLHLPAVDPMMRKFEEWGPSIPAAFDFVLGRRELSLLALTPFALDISWSMRIDHYDNKTVVMARTLTDTTSKNAKATAMQVSSIDVTNKRDFPTNGVAVTLGTVKFVVVLDGCDFRDQQGREMDLALGPEDKDTMRRWWTKTLFVPQVVGVISDGNEDSPAVQRVEVYPQEELADTLDRKVSFGFMLDVFNAIRTVIGSKQTASAIVDYERNSGEVKVFEIVVKPQHVLANQLHAKAVSVSRSPSMGRGVEDYFVDEPEVEFDGEDEVRVEAQEESDGELEFDGGELEEHSTFLKKLQQLTDELEFEIDAGETAHPSDAGNLSDCAASVPSDNEVEVQFDDDGGSVLAEAELDFDGDDESTFDDDELIAEQDELDSSEVEVALLEGDANAIPSEDELMLDGDVEDAEVTEKASHLTQDDALEELLIDSTALAEDETTVDVPKTPDRHFSMRKRQKTAGVHEVTESFADDASEDQAELELEESEIEFELEHNSPPAEIHSLLDEVSAELGIGENEDDEDALGFD